MDKDLAEKILNTAASPLRCILSDILEDWKIEATECRFNQIKEAIENTIDSNKIFLLELQDWNSNTILEEMNGNDGYIYLKQFYSRTK